MTVKKARIAINPATLQIGFEKTKTLSVTKADYQKGTISWQVTSSGNYISIPESSAGTSVEVTAGSTATPSGSPAEVTATYKIGNVTATATCQVTVAKVGTLDEKGLTWADLSTLAKVISADSTINERAAGPLTVNGKELKIGDTKSLQIGSDIYLAEIIGFKHDNLATSAQTGGYSGKTKAGITFQLKELMTTAHNMNSSNTNVGGWKDTAMRKYLNTDTNNVFSQLESAAQSVIVTAKKDYMESYDAVAVAETPTEDKLWLLACSEIWSDGYQYDSSKPNGYGYARLKEGEQYQYYITATNNGSVAYSSSNDNIKMIILGQTDTIIWGLRSPHGSYSDYFCSVYSSGGASSGGAIFDIGVSFGFSI